MRQHELIQPREASGRMDLLIAAHLHHIEGLAPAESEALVAKWFSHVTRRKNVLSMEWENEGGLVVCDNTRVLHRVVLMGEGAEVEAEAEVEEGYNQGDGG